MSEVNMNLVNHPHHYNHTDRKECWEEMREIYGDQAVAIFDILSAHKYQYRKGTKDGNAEAQDLAKIKSYERHSEIMLDMNDVNMVNADVVALQYKKFVDGMNLNK